MRHIDISFSDIDIFLHLCVCLVLRPQRQRERDQSAVSKGLGRVAAWIYIRPLNLNECNSGRPPGGAADSGPSRVVSRCFSAGVGMTRMSSLGN